MAQPTPPERIGLLRSGDLMAVLVPVAVQDLQAIVLNVPVAVRVANFARERSGQEARHVSLAGEKSGEVVQQGPPDFAVEPGDRRFARTATFIGRIEVIEVSCVG